MSLQRKTGKTNRENILKEKSDKEIESMFAQVPINAAGDTDIADDMLESGSEVDSDSDWEDIEDFEKTPEYNTLKLKNFARECDRYKTSNREGAKLANAIMKDLKLVTKSDTTMLICPGKLRRERFKWGGELEKSHRANIPPGGLYSDGKKCPTLVRDTNDVKVQVIYYKYV